jgi:hypothetical protein
MRRKTLEAIDDVARALGAFDHAVDQRRHVGQQAVDAQFLAQRVELAWPLRLAMDGFEIAFRRLA